MSRSQNDERDGDEPALDPNERWGQGTDASHPISSLEPLDRGTPTADTSDGAAGAKPPAGREGDDGQELPDDMPLT